MLSNENWNVLDKIFAPIYVQSHVLSATQQLQLYAIVFRNVLASNQLAVVEEATHNPLIYYENLPVEQITLGYIWRCGGKPGNFVSATVCPVRLAFKGAPMDVMHHSETDTQHAMNHIQVLLKLTGGSEYFCSHFDECVKTMMKIPPGEIMGLVHIAQ